MIAQVSPMERKMAMLTVMATSLSKGTSVGQKTTTKVALTSVDAARVTYLTRLYIRT